jgi:coproporphyrinogen III oxidase
MKLKEKSKFNAEASKILVEKNLYAPSVHCSYFASFQRMKVAVCHFCGKSYASIDSYVASNKTSEHRYIHREILNAIYKFDASNYGKIKRVVDDLFQYRIDADYKNLDVTMDKAQKALTYSIDIVSYMEEKFHA